jgi:hypothetical protein
VDEPGEQAARNADEAMAVKASCHLCGRPTYDPDKRERPLARALLGGSQVLVCPSCQQDRSDWAERLDRCVSCGATRLSVMLGEVVCRACGTVQGSSGGADVEDESVVMPEQPVTGA